MTVLKTSSINVSLGCFRPITFNAHLKLYVSFLGKKQTCKLFFSFLESLSLS